MVAVLIAPLESCQEMTSRSSKWRSDKGDTPYRNNF